jgi:hypothetical protein
LDFKTLPGIKHRKSTPSLPPRLRELSVTATYANPWRAHPEREYEAVSRQDGTWHPYSEDFAAAAGVPNAFRRHLTEVIDVRSLGGFLNAVTTVGGEGHKERPDRSLKRVNLFSHGNPGLLKTCPSMDPS